MASMQKKKFHPQFSLIEVFSFRPVKSVIDSKVICTSGSLFCICASSALEEINIIIMQCPYLKVHKGELNFLSNLYHMGVRYLNPVLCGCQQDLKPDLVVHLYPAAMCGQLACAAAQPLKVNVFLLRNKVCLYAQLFNFFQRYALMKFCCFWFMRYLHSLLLPLLFIIHLQGISSMTSVWSRNQQNQQQNLQSSSNSKRKRRKLQLRLIKTSKQSIKFVESRSAFCLLFYGDLNEEVYTC